MTTVSYNFFTYAYELKFTESGVLTRHPSSLPAGEGVRLPNAQDAIRAHEAVA
jgi:hypothetical protein